MVFRILSGLFCLLFLFATAVQYNDPDPVRWMAIYGLAAVVSGIAVVRKLRWPAPVIVGVPALAWGAVVTAGVWGKTTFADALGHMGMKDIHAEEAREAMGLGIVTLWMLVLLLRALRTTSARA